ncbi:MAG: hypothetical protein F4Z82_20235 [Caldilineaceae bacterium SB0668_bin_21]|nr:hypothetical protein [Caldilineaceae bacterium SB0668_bin_21]MYC22897.1 hypothetical protein [Caldilineaceae bacterium SB0662_bin_25]
MTDNQSRSSANHPGSLSPLLLSPEVQDLCKRIDQFFREYPKKHQGRDTSDLLMGVFHVMRPEGRANPVWMSQAAGSARDILYPLFSKEISEANLMRLFRKYATGSHAGGKISDPRFMDTFGTLDEIYKKLSDLTHLGANLKAFTPKEFAAFGDSDFEKLMENYVRVLGSALKLQQIYVHTIIDSIVQKKKGRSKGMKEDLKLILGVNLDARQYFFAKADEWWLGWLWKNGFLSITSESEEDSRPDSIRIPELHYLVRMGGKCPANVVNILLKIPVFPNVSNQTLLYYFLRICQSLPAHQLARVVKKIHKEKWPALMDGPAEQTGFEYSKMCKTLVTAKDYKNFLVLAKTVLIVRTEEEIGKSSRYSDTPFFFDYLSHTEIFEHLAAIEGTYAEEALALVTGVMAEVVALGEQDSRRRGLPESEWDALMQSMRSKQINASVFAATDRYSFSDVDFFDFELGQMDPNSFQSDVRKLVAVLKTLLDRIFGGECVESKQARRVYENHIVPLPDSRVIWRLKLYTWSLLPEIFTKELKAAFFRLFEVERYYDITSGSEYEKALQKGFSVLSEDEKQDFVQKTIQEFSQLPEDRRCDGSHILSTILPFLNGNPQLKEQAEATGFELDPNHEPRPVIRVDDEFREIQSRGLDPLEDFGSRPVAEIAGKLRNEWTLEELYAHNTERDRYNPVNARGIGEQMRDDMPRRLPEYIENAELFFERDVLDHYYTYLYLIGIEETIQKHRSTALEENWDGVIDLLIAIKKSGEQVPFERGRREPNWFDSWLANWDAVHLVATDVLRALLTEQDGKALLELGKCRDRIFRIISYLLSYPEPLPEDEQFETPSNALDLRAMHDDADGKWATDPLRMAVDTVRGRAFEVFTLFVEQDGKMIRRDAKELYEKVLERENTRALMSMYGRFLPQFYFRDKGWIRTLLPQIFPQDAVKKWLYTAAWEGYLTNNLDGDIISDPEIQNLYQRALEIGNSDYPRGQRHSKEPNEGIAEHLAFAFMRYKEFELDHQLLKAFWETNNLKQHTHFVSFLGRYFISWNKAEKFFTNNPESKRKLRELWDWLIERVTEPEILMELGLWINLDSGIFEPAWLVQRVKQTLEKTNGVLNWQHELDKVSPLLAQAAPEDTLEIADLYLFEGGARVKNPQTLFLWDSSDGWIEAFEILYANHTTKEETATLINKLVDVGGNAFWPLKRILAENS